MAQVERVAVLGASNKPDRYSHKAVVALLDKGHEVFPISPTGADILGCAGYSSYEELAEPPDTLTIYVNPTRLMPVLPEIVAAPPKRVIFNPGTESEEAANQLREQGVECMEACTLVLLSTGQF